MLLAHLLVAVLAGLLAAALVAAAGLPWWLALTAHGAAGTLALVGSALLSLRKAWRASARGAGPELRVF